MLCDKHRKQLNTSLNLVILNKYPDLTGTNKNILSMLEAKILEYIPGQLRLDKIVSALNRQRDPDRRSQFLDMLDLCPKRG